MTPEQKERITCAVGADAAQTDADDYFDVIVGPAHLYPFVQHEVENWIAWCWEGEDPAPGCPSRCYSAEGRYQAPAQDDHEREPRRTVNYVNAQRVQAVYDSMPALTRQVLRYEYTQRAAFDQWEQGQEISPDGELHKVWVRVGNTRRLMGRLRLSIGRVEYLMHVEDFKNAIREEFAGEVCA